MLACHAGIVPRWGVVSRGRGEKSEDFLETGIRIRGTDPVPGFPVSPGPEPFVAILVAEESVVVVGILRFPIVACVLDRVMHEELVIGVEIGTVVGGVIHAGIVPRRGENARGREANSEEF